MPLPIVKQKATGQPVGRAIPGRPLYDTEGMNAGAVAPTTLRWFSNTQGHPDASGLIVSKGYGQTNLNQAQQLPAAFKFDCHYANVKFENFTPGVGLSRTAVDQLQNQTWFEFEISQINVCRVLGLSVPGGSYLEGDINSGVDTGPSVYRSGVAHRSNAIMLKMGKSHPTIEGTEQFQATWNWATAITPPTYMDILMICEIWGIFYAPL